MKKIITLILFLTFGTISSQTECDKFEDNYIPKDLNDAIAFLNCHWSAEDKMEFKNKTENEAVSELHFGTGLAIRNNWELWKGKNKLSRFFKSKSINHPDDISSIILTSFHRQLNDKPIDLENQIRNYKKYWENAKKENEKREIEQQELSKKEFKTFKVNDTVQVAIKINKQGKNNWVYPIQKYPDLKETPDCFITGIVTDKKRRTWNKGKYVLEILVTDICGYDKAIFNGETDGLKINEEYKFSLEYFKISQDKKK